MYTNIWYSDSMGKNYTKVRKRKKNQRIINFFKMFTCDFFPSLDKNSKEIKIILDLVL